MKIFWSFNEKLKKFSFPCIILLLGGWKFNIEDLSKLFERIQSLLNILIFPNKLLFEFIFPSSLFSLSVILLLLVLFALVFFLTEIFRFFLRLIFFNPSLFKL